MNSERRTHERRVLYSPEYLDMGEDNGGVVVNLSESGLGFQAVGRVAPDSQIPVSFSLGPGYRIDVKARVVWVDSDGKLGGAAFGKLSKDSLSLIREWLLKPQVELEVENAVATEDLGQELTGQGLSEPASAAKTTEPASIEAEGTRIPLTALDTPSVKEHSGNGTDKGSESVGVVIPRQITPLPQTSSPTAGFSDAIPPTDRPVATPANGNVPSAPQGDSCNSPSSFSRDASAHSMEAPISVPDLRERAADPAREGTVRHPISSAPLREQTPMPAARPEMAAPAPRNTPPQEHQKGSTFSLTPSIAAWGTKKAPPAAGPSMPAGRRVDPLFPPRPSENIFARQPSALDPEPRSRRGSALVAIAIVIAAGAALTYYVRGHRQQIGNAIIRVGNNLSGSTASRNTVPATVPPPSQSSANPASVPPPNNTAAATPNTAVPKTVAPSASTNPQPTNPTTTTSLSPPGNPAKKPSTTSKLGTSALVPPRAVVSGGSTQNASTNTTDNGSPAAGLAEYQRAESYLNGKGVTQDYGQAAEWFWRSLEAGNTSAAIPLADLYLQGNGVSRSCMQAHILLDAAARKNNAQAIQKLAQLPENCQ